MNHIPVFLSPEQVRWLVDNRVIFYDRERKVLIYCKTVIPCDGGAAHCIGRLWENFLDGNLPMTNAEVLRGWRGGSTHISELLRRHPAWTTIVVGDGKGRFWLRVPLDLVNSNGNSQVA